MQIHVLPQHHSGLEIFTANFTYYVPLLGMSLFVCVQSIPASKYFTADITRQTLFYMSFTMRIHFAR